MRTVLVSIFAIAAALLPWSCNDANADLALGENPGVSGSITRFAVHNGYMYALNPNQIRTYSLQNPDKPQLVHTLNTDYGLETIIVYDNTIFLGSRTALYILGISNPAAPVILSRTERQDELLGGCDPVVVKGNYAFSTIKIIQNICGRVNARSALLVYDVSNLARPVQVGSWPLNMPNGLGYAGNYLFVCDEGHDHVVVFDISDPRDVKPTNYSFPLNDPIDVIARDNRLIVSAKTEFHFYDISNIANIQPLGRIAK